MRISPQRCQIIEIYRNIIGLTELNPPPPLLEGMVEQRGLDVGICSSFKGMKKSNGDEYWLNC